MTDPEPTENDGGKTKLPITRSQTFRHYAADRALVLNLGRDIELSFLLTSPIVKERQEEASADDEDNDYSYKVESALSEVARVRLPPIGCSTFAFQLLASLIDEDIDLMALKSNLDLIYKMASDAVKASKDNSRGPVGAE